MTNSGGTPLAPSSIDCAHKAISKYITRTPLLEAEIVSDLASANTTGGDHGRDFNIYFKCENLQRTGAFKARGAFYALSSLIKTHGIESIRQKGVITVSSGNHAQGLALAASTFGVPAIIVMPQSSTAGKIAGVQKTLGVESLGEERGVGAKGEIVLCGNTNQDKKATLEATASLTGAIVVPPYDHPDIILGQGTVALELSEQFNDLKLQKGVSGGRHEPHIVIAPLGGGGLLGGIATWFGGRDTNVVGAEPSFEGADDARRGLEYGSRIDHVASKTIADGLRTPVGVQNWAIVSDPSKVQGVFAVTEDEIAKAMKVLLEQVKVVVEPSAAVPLAVILYSETFRRFVAAEREARSGQPLDVVVVLSGGNTTFEAISQLLG